MKDKKLILVDFNNLIYICVFSDYLMDKYKGMKLEDSPIEKIDQISRDSFKLAIQKIFNIINRNNYYEIDIIFAKDGRKLWRKERLFSEYKEQREKKRHESGIDFDLVFKVFENVWNNLKEILPYRFICNKNVEADDIIAIAIKNEEYHKCEIYSTDNDFVQLLKYKNVEVYNPRKNEYIEIKDPKYELFYKIIYGDRGDNIPNMYSKSLTEKQSPIFKKKVKEWYDNKEKFKEYIKSQNEDVKKQYIRNVNLIDLQRIPADIEDIIINELKSNRCEFDLNKYMKMATKLNILEMNEKISLFGRI